MHRSATAMTVLTCALVLIGCTDEPPESPGTDARTTQSTAATTPDASGLGPTTSGVPRATPAPSSDAIADGEPVATGPTTAPDTPATGTLNAEQDRVTTIIQQIFDAELAARRELVAQAEDGAALDDVDDVAGLFESTRTEQAAHMEAEYVTRFGPKNLLTSVRDGLRAPTVTDVDVDRETTSCITASVTLDRVPTFNDEGDVRLDVRLVTGEGNDSGWLIDDLSTEGVDACV